MAQTPDDATKIDTAAPPAAAPRKPLTPAAERALAEAAERRAQAEAQKSKTGNDEYGGRGGLEPTRYGDWEIKGLTADF